MTIISIHDVERDSAGWLRRVEAGETLVVVRGGRPAHGSFVDSHAGRFALWHIMRIAL
jgi:hypothetical protein